MPSHGGQLLSPALQAPPSFAVVRLMWFECVDFAFLDWIQLGRGRVEVTDVVEFVRRWTWGRLMLKYKSSQAHPMELATEVSYAKADTYR